MPAEFHVYRSLDAAAGQFGPSVVTIGNFDGAHLGHQALFHRLVDLGKLLGAKPSVITFDPHPACVVAPERAPRLLTSIPQRLEWMAACGVRQVLIVPFDRDFSLLSPGEFVQRVLMQAAGAVAVLIGANFHFGRGQAGDAELLRRLGEERGFGVEAVSEIIRRGAPVSSTRIRRLVQAGNVYQASRLLGRPFALDGDVVGGHGVGSRQTVPTLNLATNAGLLPAVGVYVTRVRDLESGAAWPAVTNAGHRPTFGGEALTIESFVLEGYTDPPPAGIRVEFLHRLRDERKFPDAAALKEQILRDVVRARAYWRRLRRWASV